MELPNRRRGRPNQGRLHCHENGANGRRSYRPVHPAVRGMVAGAAGTLAMDSLLYLRYRRGGGTQRPLEWELSAGVERWDDVSAPGLVGKRILEGFLGREVPDQWARSVQNAVHWGTGMGWSAQFGVVAGLAKRPSWASGLVFGPIVWLAGYLVLPMAKIYQPIWDYDAKTLAKDLSAHLVYGVTAGTVVATLARRSLGQ